MRVITTSDFVDYRAEPCPYCGHKTLYLEFDEWNEDGTPTEAGVHVHCTNEDDTDPRDHVDMPYVYWLPVEARAYEWCQNEVRIVWNDDRKRVADWNAGKPLPGGMY